MNDLETSADIDSQIVDSDSQDKCCRQIGNVVRQR